MQQRAQRGGRVARFGRPPSSEPTIAFVPRDAFPRTCARRLRTIVARRFKARRLALLPDVRFRAYAHSVPVWAAILVALASGGFGAWLTAWNDRHERFRDRLSTAADDFSVAASEAFIAVRRTKDEIQRSNDPVKVNPLRDTGWSARDVLLIRSSRIDLLFGPGAPAGLEAAQVIHEVAKGVRHNGGQLDLAAVDQSLVDGPEHLRSFQRAAFEEIRRATPPSATVRESVRRAARRGNSMGGEPM